MPSFAEPNTNKTLEITSHCKSCELIDIVKMSNPSTQQNITIVIFELITEENETRYIMSKACIDLEFSGLKFNCISKKEDPVDYIICYDVKEFLETRRLKEIINKNE
jgi:hypothetical protein